MDLDDLHLLRQLKAELEKCSPDDRRHIIHFYDRDAYHRCVMYLKPFSGQMTGVERLDMIHALSCPLKSVERLSRFQRHIFIEEDFRVNVTQPLSLPGFSYETTESAVYPLKKLPWGIRRIRAPQAWRKSSGKGVKIAVIDTGVDFFHPDLQGRLGTGVNVLFRGKLPVDDNGHGTHIAGTIAASSKTGGLTGIAPRAVIQPVKAFDHAGTAYISDIILGIEWCIKNGVDIINLSFGINNPSLALRDAVRKAWKNGIILVASSGNEGKEEHVDYPAGFPYTVAVGATAKNKKIAPFSNWGKKIDIYAPGDNVLSTWPHGKYKRISGTSMATAHVSGVIALMKALDKHLHASEIKKILKKTANPLASEKRPRKGDAGEIDAWRAVAHLKKRLHALRR